MRNRKIVDNIFSEINELESRHKTLRDNLENTKAYIALIYIIVITAITAYAVLIMNYGGKVRLLEDENAKYKTEIEEMRKDIEFNDRTVKLIESILSKEN